MLAVWLLPLAFLFIAITYFFEKSKAGNDKSTLEILEKACASEKIGREEFLQQRDDLQAGAAGDLP